MCRLSRFPITFMTMNLGLYGKQFTTTLLRRQYEVIVIELEIHRYILLTYLEIEYDTWDRKRNIHT